MLKDLELRDVELPFVETEYSWRGNRLPQPIDHRVTFKDTLLILTLLLILNLLLCSFTFLGLVFGSFALHSLALGSQGSLLFFGHIRFGSYRVHRVTIHKRIERPEFVVLFLIDKMLRA